MAAFVARRPARTLLVGAWSAFAVIVAANAFLQASPHPAPLLAGAADAGTAAAPAESAGARPEGQGAPPESAQGDRIASLLEGTPRSAIAPERTSGGETMSPTAPVAPDDREARIRAIQGALAARGLYEGEVDGLSGPMTESAIRVFEMRSGMEPTGRASEAVYRALHSRSNAGGASRPDNARASDGRVRRVQEVLADLGYGPGAIDGALDESTRQAIRRFQDDRGLEASGEVDARLIEELEAVSGYELG